MQSPARTLATILSLALLLAADPRDVRAGSLADSVRTLYLRGRAAQAVPLIRQELAGRFAPTRSDSLKLAAWKDLLAEAQWRLQVRVATADSIAEDAVALRRALHGETSDEVARSLATQARVWRYSRSTDAAIEGLRRALALHGGHVSRPDSVAADILVSLGNALREADRPEDAIVALQRAVSIRRSVLGERHRDVARGLLNLGLAYSHAGRRQESIESGRDALDILEHAQPVDSLGLYFMNKNQASHLLAAQRGAEAGPYLARCLELRGQLFPTGSQEEADTEENSGVYQIIAGDLASSRRHFDKCGAVYEAGALGRSSGGEARYRMNRSYLDQAEGRLDSSMACAQRAAEIFSRSYRARPDPVAGYSWAAALQRVGEIHALMGDLVEAESAFAATLALNEHGRPPDHPEIAYALEQLAAVRFRMGRLDSVGTLATSAARILTTHVRREFARMTEDEALRYRGRGATAAIHLLLSLACLEPDTALLRATWGAVVSDHGLVASEITARRHLLSATRDSLLSEWAGELVRVRSRLSQSDLSVRSVPAHDSLRSAARVLEQQLATRNAQLARDFSLPDVGASEVSAALPPRTALVQFVRFARSWPSSNNGATTPSRPRPSATASPGMYMRLSGVTTPWYLAFVLEPGAATPRMVPLGEAAPVEAAIEHWQQALASGAAPSRRAVEAGRMVRRRLWDPLAPLVAGAELIVIVPDGPLAVLALQTLPGADGRPLLESAPALHMLGSPRELLSRAVSPTGSRALLVGGVDYDATPMAARVSRGDAVQVQRGRSRTCEELAPASFGSLPGTRDEVQQVARMWTSVRRTSPDLLIGAMATEAQVRAKAPGAGLLHIAAHGFLVPDSCAAPAAEERFLAADVRATPLPPGAGEAMLRSGLALAGANVHASDPANDGLLTAADLAMLDLHAAGLVVLSACESGRGRIFDAEGVVGLRWALMQAGAHAAVTSCHRVSDEVASEWMQFFYRAWLERGLRLPDAAREASRALRREILARGARDRPGAWGAFVTSGDWR